MESKSHLSGLVCCPIMAFEQADRIYSQNYDCPLFAGTWQSKPEDLVDAVAYAIKEVGYRHIDCAWYVLVALSSSCDSIRFDRIFLSMKLRRAYGNEKEVGEGIRKSGVPRSEIFVCLSTTYHTSLCLTSSILYLDHEQGVVHSPSSCRSSPR